VSQRFLTVHRDNLGESLEDFIPRVTRGEATYPELCDESLNYRALAIIALLLDGDAAGFQSNLCKAGQLFRAGLSAPGDRRRVSCSRATALFDAIACGDRTTAQAIAASLPGERKPELEYEEDYRYVRFLVDRFLLAAPRRICEAHLTEMESALQGSVDPRLDLCRALLDASQAGFDAAFEDCLTLYGDRQRLLVANGRLSEEQACTLPHVSVEALAQLSLADEIGLKTRAEYALVPARPARPVSLPPDAWSEPRAEAERR
jgi:hypothetical protein